MIIRRAVKKDLKSIADIFRIEGARPPYGRKRSPEKVLGIIKEDFRSNEISVAVIDNKVIGFIMVKRDSGIKDKLWINELWILKKYQKKGIGRKIMSEIERAYKNKGIKTFELVADKQKSGAFGFYRKLNYHTDKSLVFMIKKI